MIIDKPSIEWTFSTDAPPYKTETHSSGKVAKFDVIATASKRSYQGTEDEYLTSYLKQLKWHNGRGGGPVLSIDTASNGITTSMLRDLSAELIAMADQLDSRVSNGLLYTGSNK